MSAVLAAIVAVGLNLGSAHSEPGYNDTNPGVYAVTASGVAFGAYKNSVNRTSVWAGYRLESAPLGPFRAALLVGAVTGYGDNLFSPMVSPSVSATVGAYTARLSYLPRHPTKQNSSDAVHLSVEFSFGGAK
jgi:hypothetical protein